MKIHVKVKEGPIDIDENFEADTEEELFKLFRGSAASHAPLVIKMAIKALSDQAIRDQVVASYNYKFKTDESNTSTAKEFIAFGERAGFIRRL